MYCNYMLITLTSGLDGVIFRFFHNFEKKNTDNDRNHILKIKFTAIMKA